VAVYHAYHRLNKFSGTGRLTGITPHGQQVSTPERRRQRYIRPASDLHILLKKTLAKNNIVFGDDRAQVRFLKQRLSTEAKIIEAIKVERVTDDMLAGHEDNLYQVSMKALG
jgi:hypothetical protein